VIECEAELDVVAVYTGSVLGNATLATMETERVPARQVSVPCCVALSPTPINTGPLTQAGTTPWQSPWLITAVPSSGSTLVLGDPAPISAISSVCTWQQSYDTNIYAWVGTDCPGGSTGPTGPNDDYVYTLYFCLCCDFRNVVLHFEFWAADMGEVFLNDGGVSLSLSGAPAFYDTVYLTNAIPNDPNYVLGKRFVCGMNHLDIHVQHTNAGPSGLMVLGTISADSGGYCPPGTGSVVVFPAFPFRSP